MSRTIRLLGYVRVSSHTQEDNTSLEYQERRLRSWCELYSTPELTYQLVDVSAVVESAANVYDRRVFRRLLYRLVHLDEADGLLVLKLDRFARSAQDAHNLKAALDRRQKGVICVDEPINTFDRKAGSIYFGLAASLAEYERQTIVTRFQNGKESCRSRGQYTGGAVRYGWCLEERDGKKYLVPDQREQQVIRRVKLYHGSGVSPAGIITNLASEGLVARSGKPFQETQIERILRFE